MPPEQAPSLEYVTRAELEAAGDRVAAVIDELIEALNHAAFQLKEARDTWPK